MQPKAKHSLLILVIVAGLVAAFFLFRRENDSPLKLSRDEIEYRIKKAYKPTAKLNVQEVDIRDLIYLVYRPSLIKQLSDPSKYVKGLVKGGAIGVVKELNEPREVKTLWTNRTTVASYIDLSNAKISYNNFIGSAVGSITVTVGSPKVDPNNLQAQLGSVGLHPLSPVNSRDMEDMGAYDKNLYGTLKKTVQGHIATNLHEIVNDKALFDESAKRAAICAIRSFYRRVLPGVEICVEFEKDSFSIEGKKGSGL